MIQSNLLTGSLSNIAQSYKLFISQYLRYDDSLFTINFHIFIISFCIAMDYVTYSSSNFLSTTNSISISVNNSNFTSVFFKAVCHANPGADRNLPGPR